MAISIKRKGYGQVEPNHLSAKYTGQIYAQLPAMKNGKAIEQLENGQFLKYNYADGYAGVDGDAEWMLVYCEEKLYDERRQNHKDFRLLAKESTDGVIYPRLLKTNVGDIFTTNMFGGAGVGYDDEVETAVELSVGNYVAPGADGILAKVDAKPDGICFQVVKEYDMADGQAAVKLQRVQ